MAAPAGRFAVTCESPGESLFSLQGTRQHVASQVRAYVPRSPWVPPAVPCAHPPVRGVRAEAISVGAEIGAAEPHCGGEKEEGKGGAGNHTHPSCDRSVLGSLVRPAPTMTDDCAPTLDRSPPRLAGLPPQEALQASSGSQYVPIHPCTLSPLCCACDPRDRSFGGALVGALHSVRRNTAGRHEQSKWMKPPFLSVTRVHVGCGFFSQDLPQG